ncbi:MAG: cyclase family protein [Myxococcales bacterium]|nr:MAG: cyclase family protein [Myxococcales bacterium]
MPELPAEVKELALRVRNWGRWGPDDELGTLNLIDAGALLRGAAEIRTGKRFALGIPLDEKGPQTGVVPGRINPLRTMLMINHPYLKGDRRNFCNSDDTVTMGLQSWTHWDALSHVSYEGHIWNGYPDDVVDYRGARRCGIEKVRTLASRGVLLDVARARGVERLAGGSAVTAEDLDAAAELGRIRVEPGDVVFVRTGQMQLLRAGDRSGYIAPAPGPSLRTVEWLRRHDVAALATDSFTGEVFPAELPDTYLPIHLLHLVEMGLTQGQNFDLEALSADCAEDGRYAFFVDATPLPFTRAVASPVNPVAIK